MLTARIAKLSHRVLSENTRIYKVLYRTWKRQEYRKIIKSLKGQRVTSELVTLVDIGANRGEVTQILLQSFPRIEAAHLIDPNLTVLNYARLALADEIGADRVSLHPLAIADHSGAGYLTVDPTRPSTDQRVLTSRTGECVKTVCSELDDFLRLHGIHDRLLLKIDVQGTDVSVLRSGLESLARMTRVVVIIELDPIALEEVGESVRSLSAVIERSGFTAVLDARGTEIDLEKVWTSLYTHRKYQDILLVKERQN